MPSVAIQITRFVDEHQPGFVECVLVDASGKSHVFVEKAPVVSSENLWSTSSYPRRGSIACEVVADCSGENGQALARVNTERPWGIESTEGLTEFVVPASEVSA
ncbi:hypothetical protein ACG04R_11085 [Roseateles sp. BYS78W]|uniref:Uncharacterized protein n=1 Tax=Pelomonas candidula TaxID=3299025 RepID=A0ABW7HBF1_9BURK